MTGGFALVKDTAAGLAALLSHAAPGLWGWLCPGQTRGLRSESFSLEA